MCGSFRAQIEADTAASKFPEAIATPTVSKDDLLNTLLNQKPPHVAVTVVNNGVAFFIGTKNYLATRDHPRFVNIVEAIRAQDYDRAILLLDEKEALSYYKPTSEDFALENGLVFLDGKPFTREVSDKVANLVRDGMSPEPLERCLRKLRLNQSASAQREALLFFVANGFMIHEDGDIIAYKKVSEDFRASHPNLDGSYNYNTVGAVIEMPREDVDDRRDVTCSFGLHAASLDYAQSFGGSRLMVLKINPKDIVSIPSDYNNQKMRCCRYEVISEIQSENLRTTGLPKKEVYSDADLGVDSGVVPDPEEEVVAEIKERTILARICEVLERFSIFSVRSLVGAVLRDDTVTLYALGVTGTSVEGFLSDVEAEFDITFNDLPRDDEFLPFDELAAAVVALTQDEDDFADDFADDDEEDEEDEDYEALISYLRARIMDRTILTPDDFAQEIRDYDDLNPSYLPLRDALRDAGLGPWLM
jgi:hypothetical protein